MPPGYNVATPRSNGKTNGDSVARMYDLGRCSMHIYQEVLLSSSSSSSSSTGPPSGHVACIIGRISLSRALSTSLRFPSHASPCCEALPGPGASQCRVPLSVRTCVWLCHQDKSRPGRRIYTFPMSVPMLCCCRTDCSSPPLHRSVSKASASSFGRSLLNISS